MTLAFGICLAIGAVTVLYSLFAGGDSDADAHGGAEGGGDADATADADGGGDAGHHADADADAAGEFWLLFVSMRFWVFFLTFFGLTGLLLELVGASALAAALIAAPTGIAMGLGAAWVFKRLREQIVTSQVAPDQLVGLEAKVLLPVSDGMAGKVRLQLGGQVLDRIALLEGREELARGERALVIAVRGDKLLVARAPTPALGDGRNGNGGSAG
ncbi:MAG: hypothetical protein JXB32_20025 [Deltaproteobacteria bacterium]|nr:hypothetical protein [Deltaproteobacteria bacterium]